MTYLDQKRAQAQKMYEEEQKYWRENAEEFKKYVPSLHIFIQECSGELMLIEQVD